MNSNEVLWSQATMGEYQTMILTFRLSACGRHETHADL